eukprot:m51a1_g7504 putative polygalacturonase inhibitor 1 (621) ;mRNA; f:280562-282655
MAVSVVFFGHLGTALLLAAAAALGSRGAGVPASEARALSEFFVATGGPASWDNTQGWTATPAASDDPCAWYGVTCGAGHVEGLFLSRNGLRGVLPESAFRGLPFLTGLDLGVNALTGPLPRALGDLAQLYAVSFRENRLNGTLPFERLEKMMFAHLDFNNFEGTLEPLKNCRALKVLGLTDNSISGTIPKEFSEFTGLETLSLGGNRLTGSVPPMRTLIAVDLSRNRLTGPLPTPSLLASPALVEASLFGNEFDGPLNASAHDSVVILDAHANALSGEVPRVLASGMRSLQILHLQRNGLTGFLSPDFAATRVTDVDLSANPLFCPLPQTRAAAECTWWQLRSVTPSRAPLFGGVRVRVEGSGFVQGHQGVRCSFGGVEAPAVVVSSEVVLCTAPRASAAGPVELSLVYSGQSVSKAPLAFTYEARSGAGTARRSTHPPVEVFVSGECKCPDMASIEGVFLPILQRLGPEVVDLRLGFIARSMPEYPTHYWSLHGQTEVVGNALTLCAAKQHGMTQALVLASCLNENQSSIPSNLDVCAPKVGMDADELRACALGAEGAELLDEAVQLSDKYGAVWSPTVWINGELYCLWHSSPCKAASEDDFLKAVCAAYTGPKPAACN